MNLEVFEKLTEDGKDHIVELKSKRFHRSFTVVFRKEQKLTWYFLSFLHDSSSIFPWYVRRYMTGLPGCFHTNFREYIIYSESWKELPKEWLTLACL